MKKKKKSFFTFSERDFYQKIRYFLQAEQLLREMCKTQRDGENNLHNLKALKDLLHDFFQLNSKLIRLHIVGIVQHILGGDDVISSCKWHFLQDVIHRIRIALEHKQAYF